MAFMYREFCKNFTVYAFSRKNELPEGYTTRDMAKDQAEADAALFPGNTVGGHYEFEGYDWQQLAQLLCEM